MNNISNNRLSSLQDRVNELDNLRQEQIRMLQAENRRLQELVDKWVPPFARES